MLLTDREIEDRLAIAMAGIAAESAILGRPSTIAEDDISRATALAKAMVGLYGMSAGIGPVSVLNRNGGYLGESAHLEAIGEQTVAAFDTEVRRLVEAAMATAGDVLASQRPALEAVVARLQEDETLEGPALAQLLDAVTPAHPATNGAPTEPRAWTGTGRES